ncbi:MAG: CehA/McbA family metallohydrolase domain-containing protein [Candidatus Binataceae bacterium]
MSIRARTLVRLGIGVLAIAAIAGCAGPLPTTQLPPTRLVAPALEFPQLRDYRGVVDCRMKAAGMDESQVADLARNAQIDFVMIGDPARSGSSDYGIGGFTSQILFIPGAAFAVDGGEIVGVNLRQPIDASRPATELIGAIHDQGALALAADPGAFKSTADYALADAMEIYNQNEVFAAESPTALYWRAIFLQTDRFLLGLAPRPDANLALYDTMTAGARVTLVAGMGAPDNLSVMGAKVGAFEQLFLFYTTHLLARERAVDALMDAMRRGHAYVSFDILGYVGEFAFYAQSGQTKTMMGDEVHLDTGLTLKAELPANANRIVLLKDGVEIASAADAMDLQFAPKAAGAYRMEAWRKGHLWIISNPVYVR